jgi:hypothetical protein
MGGLESDEEIILPQIVREVNVIYIMKCRLDSVEAIRQTVKVFVEARVAQAGFSGNLRVIFLTCVLRELLLSPPRVSQNILRIDDLTGRTD